ncbi:hypothetical protein Q5P01_009080 [Channa striata]|uniref:Uncharacterized protein n=1 Tax=Channa striata TaxID=64152 RepID=A0AA88N0I5_CHASR|nr:hypothetical protein Q5P01_009080 [Channa striata]
MDQWLSHLACPCWPWSTVQTKPHRLTMQPEGGSQQLPDTGQSGGQVITSIKASSSQLSSPQTKPSAPYNTTKFPYLWEFGLHLSHKVKIPNSRGRKQKWTVLKCFTWSQTPWTYYDKQYSKTGLKET